MIASLNIYVCLSRFVLAFPFLGARLGGWKSRPEWSRVELYFFHYHVRLMYVATVADFIIHW